MCGWTGRGKRSPVVTKLHLLLQRTISYQRDLLLRHPTLDIDIQTWIRQKYTLGSRHPSRAQNHQGHSNGQVPTRAIPRDHDPWTPLPTQPQTATVAGDDTPVRVEPLVQRIGVRVFRRFLVIQTDDGDLEFPRPREESVVVVARAHRDKPPAGEI